MSMPQNIELRKLRIPQKFRLILKKAIGDYAVVKMQRFGSEGTAMKKLTHSESKMLTNLKPTYLLMKSADDSMISDPRFINGWHKYLSLIL